MADVTEIIRRERARVIASLVRAFGSLDLAEEAFQEAALKALDADPDNLAAWLTTVAKNCARDLLRHRQIVDSKAPLLREDDVSEASDIDAVSDNQLRLIFTCCHPSLAREAQVALTLKVIAGFTTDEIARAFVAPEPTIAQRIVRAKRSIEEAAIPYEVPGARELPERVGAVLSVVYFIFNEGYTASSGGLMRVDLQVEALRLSRLLCDLLPLEPDVFALNALMSFAASRAHTRVDADGAMVLLADQDRSRWDRALISEGIVSLARAKKLGDGAYLLQAEIAQCHATAPTWEATDWPTIRACYDAMLAATRSPVIALNRAVAICMIDGPRAALRALQPLEDALRSYHLYYATRADFLRRAGEDPRDDYDRALALVKNADERAFLLRQRG